MRGSRHAGLGLGAAGMLGGLGAAGMRMGGRRYQRAVPPAPVAPVAPVAPARERIIAIFPSLALTERVAISGEEARRAVGGGIVYAVDVYYLTDRGRDQRRLTRLSSLTWPTEVEDWTEVERVAVLLSNGSQVDFLLEDGIVIG